MRLRDWWYRKHPNRSVQYEIQHMTHKGGWKRHWPSVYIPEPEDRPEGDDDYWLDFPGKYRHIRRVDGRIDEVLWTYETDDAQEWYERQIREEELEEERERQREQLEQMSFEEVKAEYFGETDRLTLLDLAEIGERYDLLYERQNTDDSEQWSDNLSDEERDRVERLQLLNEALREQLDDSQSDYWP